jgi:hypothetical protein
MIKPHLEVLSFARDFHPGMGQAVAERTILRPKGYWTNSEYIPATTANIQSILKSLRSSGVNVKTDWETWADVANRVALGNALLCTTDLEKQEEYKILRKHIANATLLMSGRHLQHGDEQQPARNMEVFTNCSTSSTSFLLFYLLLNGSGVGRCYDDDMMLTNWDYAPMVRCVLDHNHPDFDWSAHESVRDAQHKYGAGRDTLWFKVPDSREGWARALEIWENAAFEKIHRDKMLLLDFSEVRPKGAPIGGMQNRPASGPVPLMNAFIKASTLKGANLSPWRQAMYIDHYFAECVLVGGARRAARMSTKFWADPSVVDFVTVKRPIEYLGKHLDAILELREEYIQEGISTPQGFLWSSNNSVTVDAEFWRLVSLKRVDEEYHTDIAKHARKVFKTVTEAAYADGTGEPGFINVDRLVQNDDGWDEFKGGDFVGSSKFSIREQTELYMSKLARRAKSKKYHTITNPCGEIALNVLGGFCVIADVVPFHAADLTEAEEAFRAATRALIRVNTMESIYSKEVSRTNRIGVGMTGVHEFAWKFFKLGFKDLLDEEKSKQFWLTLARFNRAVHNEAVKYSKQLGLNVPHTMTTIKPAGCGSLDTVVKTHSGAKSFRQIFEEHGIDLADESRMKLGTWFEIDEDLFVFDKDNSKKKVTKFYCNGYQDVYEITMEDGNSYKFTGNHQFLTEEKGWVRLDLLDGSENIVTF